MSQNHREGAAVSYIGAEVDRTLGERGVLVAISGRHGHVQWADRSITFEDLDDLGMVGRTATVHEAARDELDDSLEVGTPATAGLRTVFETEGAPGVLTRLASTGQLSTFAQIAEETRGFVQERVRSELDSRQITAQLDPEDADDLITLASDSLLRDAFGGAGGR